MKFYRTYLFSALILLGLSSCYKVRHHYLTNGVWYINSVEIDGGSTNFMKNFLTDYKEDTSFYKVMMLENGLARGEYYTDDTTLNYFVTGNWELLDNDHIMLKADEYIDGQFLIEVGDRKNIVLSTDTNYISYHDIGNVKLVIRISRDQPGNQEDTRP